MHPSSLPVHDASKLLIIDWGENSRVAPPDSLIAHFGKSVHDPEDHLKVDRTAQFLNWCLWPLLLTKTLKSSHSAITRYDSQLDWELALPIVSAINCSTNAATKICPGYYDFGRHPSSNGLSLDSAAVADANFYAQATAELFERAHKLVKLSQATVDRDALERGDSDVQPEVINTRHTVMLKRKVSAILYFINSLFSRKVVCRLGNSLS